MDIGRILFNCELIHQCLHRVGGDVDTGVLVADVQTVGDSGIGSVHYHGSEFVVCIQE